MHAEGQRARPCGRTCVSGTLGHWDIAYLILVSTASTGGGGLFSSRRTFFHREHGRYCFRKVYSENITHKILYTPNKKLCTPTKNPSTPTKIASRQIKRFSMIKTLIMPRKKQVRQ